MSSSGDRTPPRSPSAPPKQSYNRSINTTPWPSEGPFSPSAGHISDDAGDRVFPIRSVVTRDPNPTPASRSDRNSESGYFSHYTPRRFSVNSNSARDQSGSNSSRQGSTDSGRPRAESLARETEDSANHLSAQYMSDLAGTRPESISTEQSEHPRSPSTQSRRSAVDDNGAGVLTARFKHVVSEGGHMIITGRDGETLQRCEDEPIHIPGAVQGFGLLIALEEESEGKLVVRIVSENSRRLIGYTPRQLFALESFTDILTDEQADNLLDHVDFIRDEDSDVAANGPEVFTLSIRPPGHRVMKLWCAMHINENNPNLVICEFELEDDPVYPLVPPNDSTPEPPEDTLDSDPTPQEYAESTQNISRPLRVLRSARKRKGEAAAMEVFNIMSQVQEQLAAAPNLERFLKVLCGVVKELTGFHRVMIYQFDQAWNGRVVTELVDPRATKDLYKGLNFPASDIPKQARDLYKINKVRMLYDRDQETARLVCRTAEDLKTPLDLTYAYLRAMSPIHLKYLGNMAVRSSMSISINAFEELWGLIACHSYGAKGMRVSFPIRKMCRLVGDTASRNIERLSYASRLQARKLINTVPTSSNPSGYIIASSEDLLKLFDADYGLLSIRDETKILGPLDQSQEALAMLEYLRMRKITNVMTTQDIVQDFPDLRYPPGFKKIAGLLLVPLSTGGQDFIVFFRKGQLREVKWAGNPYEKFIKAGTEGYLEPRKSFKTWSETVVGKCREWTEEEIETAAVLCLVYGKFIEVWRQKEAALQSSQLTRLLLANSAHEVRTPLNAIINYLEIALEGSLDQETRDNLAKSHSASKSLIYVINDLLDLTKTEEGANLIKDEAFDLQSTVLEATDIFKGDARRKQITYDIIQHPGLPSQVIGDQRKIRQAISNITANAIQNTSSGGVTVEVYLVSQTERQVDIECAVTDTGLGISDRRLDTLFRELEQVQIDADDLLNDAPIGDQKLVEGSGDGDKRTLGLGLAVVARIIRNMNGQMRLKSEEGKGSRFVLQFPFQLPDSEPDTVSIPPPSIAGSETPLAEQHRHHSSDDVLEKIAIERDPARRNSLELRGDFGRRSSTESLSSRHSLGSMNSKLSGKSTQSQRSEADRLIDAISEPHMVGTIESNNRSGSRPTSANSSRPLPPKRSSTGNSAQTTVNRRPRSNTMEAHQKERSREMYVGPPGQTNVPDQGTPIRSIRVLDDEDGASPNYTSGLTAAGTSQHDDSAAPSVNHMRVLVAEDDPVNSKIIKKRLEKLGHHVMLTVNGEECASAYGDKSEGFDVILMDMQMPIVDGLTATKMIRSYEKSHPTHVLSARAALNGRIPIIAVSASLLERNIQSYISAGFDGWILKPISFDRLQDIMRGIVQRPTRSANLYRPGSWERGGWFHEVQEDIYAADTHAPDQAPSSMTSEQRHTAAASERSVAEEAGSGGHEQSN